MCSSDLVKGLSDGKIKAAYKISINSESVMNIEYEFSGLPADLIREAGIQFIAGDLFDTLRWKRETYWKGYAGNNLSGPEGRVALYSDLNKKYRSEPQKDWIFDKKSFFYNGTGDETADQLTNVARSTKEDIYEYALHLKTGGEVNVSSNAEKSCRIARHDEGIRLFINDIVDYPDIAWGNYSANVSLSSFSGKSTVLLK